MSRKISRLASQALMSKTPFRLSNTEVKVYDDTAFLYLYGNLIASLDKDVLSVSLAGYPTNTTKERLNALPGVHIFQKQGGQFISSRDGSAHPIHNNTFYPII